MADSYKSLLKQAERYSFSYIDGTDKKEVFPTSAQLAALLEFDEALPENGA